MLETIEFEAVLGTDFVLNYLVFLDIDGAAMVEFPPLIYS